MLLKILAISQASPALHPEIRENSAWMRDVGKASDQMMSFGVSAADAVIIAAMVPPAMMILRMAGEFTSVLAEDLRENNAIKREERRARLREAGGSPPPRSKPGEVDELPNGRPR